MPRTRRVDCADPGITRVRRGRGFSYVDHDGSRIDDPDALERFASLAIPPAWTDVWICPDPRGHIQATGIDDAGRKQYRYHDDWREHRDRLKFDEMLDFARKLPKLRRRIGEGLDRKGLAFERTAACGTALLDQGLFRVGSERYADEHGSFGLTTLQLRHLSFEPGQSAVFKYRAKGGLTSRHTISEPDVVRALRSLATRRGAKPGARLLVYRRGKSNCNLNPEQLNEWIKETMGSGFSAKDFRTWNATVLAAVALSEHEPAELTTKAANRRAINASVERVSEYLNNTPAVARSSYIDPRVFDRFDAGETIAPALERLRKRRKRGRFVEREAIERAVIRLLDR